MAGRAALAEPLGRGAQACRRRPGGHERAGSAQAAGITPAAPAGPFPRAGRGATGSRARPRWTAPGRPAQVRCPAAQAAGQPGRGARQASGGAAYPGSLRHGVPDTTLGGPRQRRNRLGPRRGRHGGPAAEPRAPGRVPRSSISTSARTRSGTTCLLRRPIPPMPSRGACTGR